MEGGQVAGWWGFVYYLHPLLLWQWITGPPSWVYRIYHSIKSGLDPRFRRRRRLLSWVEHAADRQVIDLANLWKDGSIICQLIQRSCPGGVGQGLEEWNESHSRDTFRHAQALAYRCLMLEPAFSEVDLSRSELTPNIEKRLFRYLQALKQAINKKQITRSVDEDSEGETMIAEEYIARGMGLIMASRKQRAIFYVYSRDGSSLMDIHIEIRGPGEDFGSLLVTDSENYNDTSGSSIPIEYRLTDEYLRVSYQPRSVGHHELSIGRHGYVIPGSPFLVSVDDITEKQPRKRFNSIEWFTEDEERRQKALLEKKKNAKVKYRIVDFVTEKMYLTEDGKLIKISEDAQSTPTPKPLPPAFPAPKIPTMPEIIFTPDIHSTSPSPSCDSSRSSSRSRRSISPKTRKRRDKPSWTVKPDVMKYVMVKPQKSEVKRMSDAASQASLEIHPQIFQEKCKKIVTVCDYLLRLCPKQTSLEIISGAGQILQTGHPIKDTLTKHKTGPVIINELQNEDEDDDVFFHSPCPSPTVKTITYPEKCRSVSLSFVQDDSADLKESEDVKKVDRKESADSLTSHSAWRARESFKTEGNTKSPSRRSSFSAITQTNEQLDQDDFLKVSSKDQINTDGQSSTVDSSEITLLSYKKYSHSQISFDKHQPLNLPNRNYSQEDLSKEISINKGDDCDNAIELRENCQKVQEKNKELEILQWVEGKSFTERNASDDETNMSNIMKLLSLDDVNQDKASNDSLESRSSRRSRGERAIHRLSQDENKVAKKPIMSKGNLVGRIVAHFETTVNKEIENQTIPLARQDQSINNFNESSRQKFPQSGSIDEDRLHLEYLKSIGADNESISKIKSRIELFEKSVSFKAGSAIRPTSPAQNIVMCSAKPEEPNRKEHVASHIFRAEPALVVSRHYAELQDISIKNNNSVERIIFDFNRKSQCSEEKEEYDYSKKQIFDGENNRSSPSVIRGVSATGNFVAEMIEEADETKPPKDNNLGTDNMSISQETINQVEETKIPREENRVTDEDCTSQETIDQDNQTKKQRGENILADKVCIAKKTIEQVTKTTTPMNTNLITDYSCILQEPIDQVKKIRTPIEDNVLDYAFTTIETIRQEDETERSIEANVENYGSCPFQETFGQVNDTGTSLNSNEVTDDDDCISQEFTKHVDDPKTSLNTHVVHEDKCISQATIKQVYDTKTPLNANIVTADDCISGETIGQVNDTEVSLNENVVTDDNFISEETIWQVDGIETSLNENVVTDGNFISEETVGQVDDAETSLNENVVTDSNYISEETIGQVDGIVTSLNENVVTDDNCISEERIGQVDEIETSLNENVVTDDNFISEETIWQVDGIETSLNENVVTDGNFISEETVGQVDDAETSLNENVVTDSNYISEETIGQVDGIVTSLNENVVTDDNCISEERIGQVDEIETSLNENVVTDGNFISEETVGQVDDAETSLNENVVTDSNYISEETIGQVDGIVTSLNENVVTDDNCISEERIGQVDEIETSLNENVVTDDNFISEETIGQVDEIETSLNENVVTDDSCISEETIGQVDEIETSLNENVVTDGNYISEETIGQVDGIVTSMNENVVTDDNRISEETIGQVDEIETSLNENVVNDGNYISEETIGQVDRIVTSLNENVVTDDNCISEETIGQVDEIETSLNENVVTDGNYISEETIGQVGKIETSLNENVVTDGNFISEETVGQVDDAETSLNENVVTDGNYISEETIGQVDGIVTSLNENKVTDDNCISEERIGQVDEIETSLNENVVTDDNFISEETIGQVDEIETSLNENVVTDDSCISEETIGQVDGIVTSLNENVVTDNNRISEETIGQVDEIETSLNENVVNDGNYISEETIGQVDRIVTSLIENVVTDDNCISEETIGQVDEIETSLNENVVTDGNYISEETIGQVGKIETSLNENVVTDDNCISEETIGQVDEIETSLNENVVTDGNYISEETIGQVDGIVTSLHENVVTDDNCISEETIGQVDEIETSLNENVVADGNYISEETIGQVEGIVTSLNENVVTDDSCISEESIGQVDEIETSLNENVMTDNNCISEKTIGLVYDTETSLNENVVINDNRISKETIKQVDDTETSSDENVVIDGICISEETIGQVDADASLNHNVVTYNNYISEETIVQVDDTETSLNENVGTDDNCISEETIGQVDDTETSLKENIVTDDNCISEETIGQVDEIETSLNENVGTDDNFISEETIGQVDEIETSLNENVGTDDNCISEETIVQVDDTETSLNENVGTDDNCISEKTIGQVDEIETLLNENLVTDDNFISEETIGQVDEIETSLNENVETDDNCISEETIGQVDDTETSSNENVGTDDNCISEKTIGQVDDTETSLKENVVTDDNFISEETIGQVDEIETSLNENVETDDNCISEETIGQVDDTETSLNENVVTDDNCISEETIGQVDDADTSLKENVVTDDNFISEETVGQVDDADTSINANVVTDGNYISEETIGQVDDIKTPTDANLATDDDNISQEITGQVDDTETPIAANVVTYNDCISQEAVEQNANSKTTLNADVDAYCFSEETIGQVCDTETLSNKNVVTDDDNISQEITGQVDETQTPINENVMTDAGCMSHETMFQVDIKTPIDTNVETNNAYISLETIRQVDDTKVPTDGNAMANESCIFQETNRQVDTTKTRLDNNIVTVDTFFHQESIDQANDIKTSIANNSELIDVCMFQESYLNVDNFIGHEQIGQLDKNHSLDLPIEDPRISQVSTQYVDENVATKIENILNEGACISEMTKPLDENNTFNYENALFDETDSSKKPTKIDKPLKVRVIDYNIEKSRKDPERNIETIRILGTNKFVCNEELRSKFPLNYTSVKERIKLYENSADHSNTAASETTSKSATTTEYHNEIEDLKLLKVDVNTLYLPNITENKGFKMIKSCEIARENKGDEICSVNVASIVKNYEKVGTNENIEKEMKPLPIDVLKQKGSLVGNISKYEINSPPLSEVSFKDIGKPIESEVGRISSDVLSKTNSRTRISDAVESNIVTSEAEHTLAVNICITDPKTIESQQTVEAEPKLNSDQVTSSAPEPTETEKCLEMDKLNTVNSSMVEIRSPNQSDLFQDTIVSLGAVEHKLKWDSDQEKASMKAIMKNDETGTKECDFLSEEVVGDSINKTDYRNTRNSNIIFENSMGIQIPTASETVGTVESLLLPEQSLFSCESNELSEELSTSRPIPDLNPILMCDELRSNEEPVSDELLGILDTKTVQSKPRLNDILLIETQVINNKCDEIEYISSPKNAVLDLDLIANDDLSYKALVKMEESDEPVTVFQEALDHSNLVSIEETNLIASNEFSTTLTSVELPNVGNVLYRSTPLIIVEDSSINSNPKELEESDAVNDETVVKNEILNVSSIKEPFSTEEVIMTENPHKYSLASTESVYEEVLLNAKVGEMENRLPQEENDFASEPIETIAQEETMTSKILESNEAGLKEFQYLKEREMLGDAKNSESITAISLREDDLLADNDPMNKGGACNIKLEYPAQTDSFDQVGMMLNETVILTAVNTVNDESIEASKELATQSMEQNIQTQEETIRTDQKSYMSEPTILSGGQITTNSDCFSSSNQEVLANEESSLKNDKDISLEGSYKAKLPLLKEDSFLSQTLDNCGYARPSQSALVSKETTGEAPILTDNIVSSSLTGYVFDISLVTGEGAGMKETTQEEARSCRELRNVKGSSKSLEEDESLIGNSVKKDDTVTIDLTSASEGTHVLNDIVNTSVNQGPFGTTPPTKDSPVRSEENNTINSMGLFEETFTLPEDESYSVKSTLKPEGFVAKESSVVLKENQTKESILPTKEVLSEVKNKMIGSSIPVLQKLPFGLTVSTDGDNSLKEEVIQPYSEDNVTAVAFVLNKGAEVDSLFPCTSIDEALVTIADACEVESSMKLGYILENTEKIEVAKSKPALEAPLPRDGPTSQLKYNESLILNAGNAMTVPILPFEEVVTRISEEEAQYPNEEFSLTDKSSPEEIEQKKLNNLPEEIFNEGVNPIESTPRQEITLATEVLEINETAEIVNTINPSNYSNLEVTEYDTIESKHKSEDMVLHELLTVTCKETTILKDLLAQESDSSGETLSALESSTGKVELECLCLEECLPIGTPRAPEKDETTNSIPAFEDSLPEEVIKLDESTTQPEDHLSCESLVRTENSEFIKSNTLSQEVAFDKDLVTPQSSERHDESLITDVTEAVLSRAILMPEVSVTSLTVIEEVKVSGSNTLSKEVEIEELLVTNKETDTTEQTCTHEDTLNEIVGSDEITLDECCTLPTEDSVFFEVPITSQNSATMDNLLPIEGIFTDEALILSGNGGSSETLLQPKDDLLSENIPIANEKAEVKPLRSEDLHKEEESSLTTEVCIFEIATRSLDLVETVETNAEDGTTVSALQQLDTFSCQVDNTGIENTLSPEKIKNLPSVSDYRIVKEKFLTVEDLPLKTNAVEDHFCYETIVDKSSVEFLESSVQNKADFEGSAMKGTKEISVGFKTVAKYDEYSEARLSSKEPEHVESLYSQEEISPENEAVTDQKSRTLNSSHEQGNSLIIETHMRSEGDLNESICFVNEDASDQTSLLTKGVAPRELPLQPENHSLGQISAMAGESKLVEVNDKSLDAHDEIENTDPRLTIENVSPDDTGRVQFKPTPDNPLFGEEQIKKVSTEMTGSILADQESDKVIIGSQYESIAKSEKADTAEASVTTQEAGVLEAETPLIITSDYDAIKEATSKFESTIQKEDCLMSDSFIATEEVDVLKVNLSYDEKLASGGLKTSGGTESIEAIAEPNDFFLSDSETKTENVEQASSKLLSEETLLEEEMVITEGDARAYEPLLKLEEDSLPETYVRQVEIELKESNIQPEDCCFDGALLAAENDYIEFVPNSVNVLVDESLVRSENSAFIETELSLEDCLPDGEMLDVEGVCVKNSGVQLKDGYYSEIFVESKDTETIKSIVTPEATHQVICEPRILFEDVVNSEVVVSNKVAGINESMAHVDCNVGLVIENEEASTEATLTQLISPTEKRVIVKTLVETDAIDSKLHLEDDLVSELKLINVEAELLVSTNQTKDILSSELFEAPEKAFEAVLKSEGDVDITSSLLNVNTICTETAHPQQEPLNYKQILDIGKAHTENKLDITLKNGLVDLELVRTEENANKAPIVTKQAVSFLDEAATADSVAQYLETSEDISLIREEREAIQMRDSMILPTDNVTSGDFLASEDNHTSTPLPEKCWIDQSFETVHETKIIETVDFPKERLLLEALVDIKDSHKLVPLHPEADLLSEGFVEHVERVTESILPTEEALTGDNLIPNEGSAITDIYETGFATGKKTIVADIIHPLANNFSVNEFTAINEGHARLYCKVAEEENYLTNTEVTTSEDNGTSDLVPPLEDDLVFETLEKTENIMTINAPDKDLNYQSPIESSAEITQSQENLLSDVFETERNETQMYEEGKEVVVDNSTFAARGLYLQLISNIATFSTESKAEEQCHSIGNVYPEHLENGLETSGKILVKGSSGDDLKSCQKENFDSIRPDSENDLEIEKESENHTTCELEGTISHDLSDDIKETPKTPCITDRIKQFIFPEKDIFHIGKEQNVQTPFDTCQLTSFKGLEDSTEDYCNQNLEQSFSPEPDILSSAILNKRQDSFNKDTSTVQLMKTKFESKTSDYTAPCFKINDAVQPRKIIGLCKPMARTNNDLLTDNDYTLISEETLTQMESFDSEENYGDLSKHITKNECLPISLGQNTSTDKTLTSQNPFLCTVSLHTLWSDDSKMAASNINQSQEVITTTSPFVDSSFDSLAYDTSPPEVPFQDLEFSSELGAVKPMLSLESEMLNNNLISVEHELCEVIKIENEELNPDIIKEIETVDRGEVIDNFNDIYELGKSRIDYFLASHDSLQVEVGESDAFSIEDETIDQEIQNEISDIEQDNETTNIGEIVRSMYENELERSRGCDCVLTSHDSLQVEVDDSDALSIEDETMDQEIQNEILEIELLPSLEYEPVLNLSNEGHKLFGKKKLIHIDPSLLEFDANEDQLSSLENERIDEMLLKEVSKIDAIEEDINEFESNKSIDSENTASFTPVTIIVSDLNLENDNSFIENKEQNGRRKINMSELMFDNDETYIENGDLPKNEDLEPIVDLPIPERVKEHDMNNYAFFKNSSSILNVDDKDLPNQNELTSMEPLESLQTELSGAGESCSDMFDSLNENNFSISTESEDSTEDFQMWSSNVEFGDPTEDDPENMDFDSIISAPNLDEALKKLEAHIQDKGDDFQWLTPRTPSPSLQSLEKYFKEGVYCFDTDKFYAEVSGGLIPELEKQIMTPKVEQTDIVECDSATIWATPCDKLPDCTYVSGSVEAEDLSIESQEDEQSWIISPYQYPRVILSNTGQMSIIDEEDDQRKSVPPSPLQKYYLDASFSSDSIEEGKPEIHNVTKILKRLSTDTSNEVDQTLEEFDRLTTRPSVDESQLTETDSDNLGLISYTSEPNRKLYLIRMITQDDSKEAKLFESTPEEIEKAVFTGNDCFESNISLGLKDPVENIKNCSEKIFEALDHTKPQTTDNRSTLSIDAVEPSVNSTNVTTNEVLKEEKTVEETKSNLEFEAEEKLNEFTVTERKKYWDEKLQKIKEQDSLVSSCPKSLSRIKSGTVQELMSCFTDDGDDTKKSNEMNPKHTFSYSKLAAQKEKKDLLKNKPLSLFIPEPKQENVETNTVQSPIIEATVSETASMKLVSHWKTFWDDMISEQQETKEKVVCKIPSIQISEDGDSLNWSIGSEDDTNKVLESTIEEENTNLDSHAMINNQRGTSEEPPCPSQKPNIRKHNTNTVCVQSGINSGGLDSKENDELINDNVQDDGFALLCPAPRTRSYSTGHIDTEVAAVLEQRQKSKVETINFPDIKHTDEQNDFKIRFERAKQFFKHLEKSGPDEIKYRDYKSMPKLENLSSKTRKPSVESDSGTETRTRKRRDRYRNRRKKKKDTSKIHSAPTSDTETAKRVDNKYSFDSVGGSVKGLKVSERFHVKDLFQDMSGKVGLFRGIPNHAAVLASLRSVDDVRAISPYEMDYIDPKSASLGNIPAGFQEEYPYLPTTPINRFRPRSALEFNLIPRSELLDQQF